MLVTWHLAAWGLHSRSAAPASPESLLGMPARRPLPSPAVSAGTRPPGGSWARYRLGHADLTLLGSPQRTGSPGGQEATAGSPTHTRRAGGEGWCRPGPLCLGNTLSRLQSFPFHQPPTSNPICSLRPTSSVELPRFSESGAGGCSVAGEGTSILPGTDAPGGHNLLDRCMCSGCSCSGRGEESCDRLGARGCKTLL